MQGLYGRSYLMVGSQTSDLYQGSNHPSTRNVEGSNERFIPVFLGDTQVGRLTKKGDRISFSYNAVAKSRNLWLSSAMKDMDKVYVGEANCLPPFFANLLPEGRRLDALASSLRISVRDEFGLYEVLGGQVIGNTRVIPSKDMRREELLLEVDHDAVKTITFSEMLELSSDVTSNQFDVHSVPGVQNKVSRVAKLLGNTGLSLGHQAQILPLVIIKLEEDEHDQIVQNESFFLRVAERAGLRIPRYAQIEDPSGSSALIVERFDRYVVDGEVRRIYVEDACQLQARHPREKYQGSYERTCRAVMDAVDDPQRAAKELFRSYIFSYGIANGDLHTKNLSIWKNPHTDEIELAPTYDVLCTYVYGDKKMALSIKGKNTNILPGTFIQFAESLGLNLEDVAEITKDVSSAIKDSLPSIGDIGLNRKKADLCASTIAKRVDTLDQIAEHALSKSSSVLVEATLPQR